MHKTAPRRLGSGHGVPGTLGILGAEASFHRLLSLLFKNQPGTLIHTDRIILYDHNREQNLKSLTKVLTLLGQHQLHTNSEGTPLGTNDASVMGFHINNGLVQMSPDQLGNAHRWETPTDTNTI